MHAVLFLIVLLLVLLPALFLLARRQRAGGLGDELSAISRQHIDLFQGGQLNEQALESTKARFRDLLERGEVEAVEASLRAGEQYVVQVRALAELGTEDAGRILERQLTLRLTEDQLEQTWYWIDLAAACGRSTARRACRTCCAAPSRPATPRWGTCSRRRRCASWASRATCGSRRRRWGGRPCGCCCGRWRGCATACRRSASPTPAWASRSRPCGT